MRLSLETAYQSQIDKSTRVGLYKNLDSLKMDKVRFEKNIRKGASYGFAQSNRGEKESQGF